MKNLIVCLVGLASVAASGCAQVTDALLREPGGRKQPEREEMVNLSPQTIAAQRAANAPPTGPTVTLTGDFAPNPSVMGPFSTKGTVGVTDITHMTRCDAYVYVGERPTAVVRFTNPMKNTRISVLGASVILARLGNGQYVCNQNRYGDASTVALEQEEWPAGDVTLFAGGRNGLTYAYEILVEDVKRPIDIVWKTKVKPIEIAEMPKDPIVISEVTPKAAGVKIAGRNCGDGYFREVPDAALELKRPLGNITVEVRSTKRVNVQLLGPLTEDGRKIPKRCLNVSMNRMEAGLYGLWVGTESSGAEVLYHLVLRGKEPARNPALAPAKLVEQATVDESAVMWHFPQLTSSDAENNDAVREALFMAAPKAIFVFPKFNMDNSVAKVAGGAEASAKDEDEAKPSVEDKAPQFAYPKENEPLLLLDREGRVLAADGSVFRVNIKDLQADPSGPTAWPAAPRNAHLSFERAVAMIGPEDAKSVASYENAKKAAEACWERLSVLSSSARLPCEMMDKANANAKVALKKNLAKSRSARRAARLAKIKIRVEALFNAR